MPTRFSNILIMNSQSLIRPFVVSNGLVSAGLATRYNLVKTLRLPNYYSRVIDLSTHVTRE